MRKPDDQKYRDMIVRNLDCSMLVEAGAGSGKTTSLVSRMLALIGESKCTVDRMAAVTFTRKAAAELKGRFQIALEDALKKEPDGDRKARYRTALSDLNLLFAGTIHSFCGRLLRERPVEAGIDPDFQELEEEENAILRDQCWSDYIEGLYTEGAEVLGKLAELGLNVGDLVQTYRDLAVYPEVEVITVEEVRPDFARQKKELEIYIERAYKSIPETVPEKGWDGLQKMVRQAHLRSRHLDMGVDRDFIRVLTGLEKSPGITHNRWPGGKEEALRQRDVFESFKTRIVEPCLEQWRRYCHFFIMKLVIPGVAYFCDARRKNSLMNYSDLLLRCAELLRNNSEVRYYFQERVTHLLVDEFQDTDPIQAEVILYLSGEDNEERSWQNLRIRPGALFIVGDPKQSIYRFRRADIDIYNKVKALILSSGGEVVFLTTNFRSLPAVCDWINPVFKSRFPEKADQYQAAYEQMDPFRKDKGGGVRRITIGKVTKNNQEEIAKLDAERIAGYIRRSSKYGRNALNTNGEPEDGEIAGFSPGDFMILLRYKAHMPVYARALELAGIPYEVSGGGAFNESDEIRQFLNLLTAVACPEDPISLVAALRGAFYGISDDLLYRFKDTGGVFFYFDTQNRFKDPTVREKIGAVLSEIRTFHQWTRVKPPAAAMNMILDHLGIVSLSMTKDMGKSRAGNLLKAIEIVLQKSGGTMNTFSDMVELLEKHYSELEVEEMSVDPGKVDVVRIMNLHKAKGLEAPVVFLADPLKESSHEPSFHISRQEGKAVGHFVSIVQHGEFKREIAGLPADWQNQKAREQNYQDAEEDRLLYVATTRAKQLLVVSCYPEKMEKGGWKALYPYLSEIKELESGEKQAPSAAPEEKILPEHFIEARKQITKRISESRTASYCLETVTESSKGRTANIPFSGETGRGMSWGRIVHRMLETLVRKPSIDLGPAAESFLEEERRPLSEREDVVETVKTVISSPLWKRMQKSEKALVETPFSIRVEHENQPKIISGAIDLAFREPDGWVIADYKTDKTDGNLDSLIDYYRPQVEMYKRLWQEMSGEKVKEAGLYFVDTGQWARLS